MSNIKKSALVLISVLLLACANDATYRMRDPKTCISTGGSAGCSEKQASANRVVLFEQCKSLNGTPSLRYIDANLAPTLVMGFNCLLPDGSVRDLYAEKFEKETGKKVFN